ncbi:phospholipase [Natrarchaeobius halalkaliphilus]|uniref:Phospholipase n=1 Tax=Natrarchaeobius halalkaliphilus TaxID=1679091 RepID=A0A3N6LI79_9EURY|nr:phospholipase D-like domain-containing protein [Natrarchaeobius halalkaliphilus]RQG87014.1 phospholipase [Natrarchaeobius halalkaliphilus]
MSVRRVTIVVAAALLLLTTLATGVPSTAPTADRPLASPATGPTGPGCVPAHETSAETDLESVRVVELYPNPTTFNNAGEFVVLEAPPETDLESWTLTDGHTTAEFPNVTVSGRIAASTEPEITDELTDDPVLGLDGAIRLAVDGDELELRNGTETVDAVAYDEAPLAQRWHRTSDDLDGDGRWTPRDGTCFSTARIDAETATTFVLPDSPAVPLETIRDADDRLLLAGYTLTSPAVETALVEASDRGVEVAVLLESGPVGGTPAATGSMIERLEDAGVEVRMIGGEGARYRFHHPKYAVVDDRVLVTSENWKPSGIGGESSRGWGVRIGDESLATELETVFRADFEGWDTQSGSTFRQSATFVENDGVSSPSEFETVHEAATVPVDSVELLVAPDNADRRLAELLADADDEILVKQASIADDVVVLEETLAAARRGVDVRILLDSTWYNEDENAALADDLEAIAATEGLSLEAKLVEDSDRFEKVHAKGVVIDREIAVVGSANWNDNAFENNREVLVALHSGAAGEYFAAVFEADWNGGVWSLPIELSVTVVALLVGAALLGRRYVRFGDRNP